MLLDIVILPPAELRHKLGTQIKHAAQGYPHIFVVDNKILIPHVSLFHIRSSNQKLKKMAQIIQDVIKKHKLPEIRSIALDVGNEVGRSWFGIGLSNSKRLRALHEAMVYSLRDLRTGMMPVTSKHVSKQGLEYRKNFGSRHILKNFYPHITLAMFKNPLDAKAIAQKWKGLRLNFVPQEVAITEVNFWHQVTRVIKKFKLGNPSSGLRPSPRREMREGISSPDGRRELRPDALDKALGFPSPKGRGARGEGSVSKAVKTLKAGGIVVYPTDTSYGLAVDATNVIAVRKLYKLKGRGFKKPVHVICSYSNTAPYYSIGKIVKLNTHAKKLIKKFWPGPLTIVLPLKAKGKSWQMLSAGTRTLGVRYPAHKLARALVEELGKPITTTSANIAGGPDCYSISEVKKQFAKSKLSTNITFLDGGGLPKTKPSTVVSLIEHVKILREGPITKKQIEKALK
ncbi:MAG: threonylcarbamoyl-AMP synthase [Candidatus Doudnabacteria bacterium]|nr:threonylcarbamoyl-AMP synthase [Candidatus Doudnabacteria bacterium]